MGSEPASVLRRGAACGKTADGVTVILSHSSRFTWRQACCAAVGFKHGVFPYTYRRLKRRLAHSVRVLGTNRTSHYDSCWGDGDSAELTDVGLLLQVPCASVPRRYIMLRYGNGVRCRGDPGALLQDIAALLPTPNLQLRVVMSPVVRPRPLPKTPRSQVSSSDLSCPPPSYSFGRGKSPPDGAQHFRPCGELRVQAT